MLSIQELSCWPREKKEIRKKLRDDAEDNNVVATADSNSATIEFTVRCSG